MNASNISSQQSVTSVHTAVNTPVNTSANTPIYMFPLNTPVHALVNTAVTPFQSIVECLKLLDY